MITIQGMLNLRDEWTRYCVYEDNELVGTQGEDVLRNFRRAERQGYMGRFSHHDDGDESSIFWFKYAEDKHPCHSKFCHVTSMSLESTLTVTMSSRRTRLHVG